MKKKKPIFVQKVHKKAHFGTTLCQNQDFFGMKTLLHFHFFQSDLLSKDRQVGLNIQSVDFVKISFFRAKIGLFTQCRRSWPIKLYFLSKETTTTL